MKTTTRLVIYFISFLVLLLAGCGAVKSYIIGHYTLGIVGPESGSYGESGVDIVEGARFRIGEIIMGGARINGKTVNLVYYDDQSDAERCRELTERLIKVDEVFAVICYNPDPEAISGSVAVCQENSTPFISISGGYIAENQPVSMGGFELSRGDRYISEKGIQYIFENMNIENPAIVNISELGEEDTPEGLRGLIEELAGIDKNTALDIMVGDSDIDLVAASSDIKYSNADAVFIYSNSTDTFRLARELEIDLVTIPIINIKPFTEPGTIEDEISLNRYIYFFSPLPLEFASIKAEQFERHFVELKGFPPNYYHCIGYEAVDFASYAVNKAKSDEAKDIKKAWDGMEKWSGILGDTNMKTGNTDFTIYVYRSILLGGFTTTEVEAVIQ